MIIRVLAFLALLLTSARADVTITNYVGGTLFYEQVTKYDTDYNQIDGHEWIVEVDSSGHPCTDPGVGGCTFYMGATGNSCGFVWKQTGSPWCAVDVYSSTDLNVWDYLGDMWDVNNSLWQNYCATWGCGDDHIIYNAANDNFLVWINQFGGNTVLAPQKMLVVTCTFNYALKQPFVCNPTPSTPTHLVQGPGSQVGDFDVASDGSGNGYIAYHMIGGSIWIEQLNSAFNDSAGGTSVDISSGATDKEGVNLFVKGSQFYSIFGPSCGFCAGVQAYYTTSATPLTGGSWSAPAVISSASDGCQGQPFGTSVITAGANVTYLFRSNQTRGSGYGATSNWYSQPLSFSGTAISAFPCNQTVTIPGLTPTSPPAAPGGAPDQTSVAASHGNIPDVSTDLYDRMQTFVPTKATLSSVYMLLAQGVNLSGANLNGNLTVSLATVDGSNNPVATLASVAVTPAQLSWDLAWMKLPFNYCCLTPGTHYALVLSTANGSAGGVSVAFTNTDAYAAGIERWSHHGVNSWTSEPGGAIVFSTIPPAVVGGRRVRIP